MVKPSKLLAEHLTSCREIERKLDDDSISYDEKYYLVLQELMSIRSEINQLSEIRDMLEGARKYMEYKIEEKI